MDSAALKREYLARGDRDGYLKLVRDSARGITPPASHSAGPVLRPKPKPPAAPVDFWDIVSRKQDSGLTRGAAVRAAVAEYPIARNAWLQSRGAR